MPSSFSVLKLATKPKLKNQPPYAAVSVHAEPHHMVVFLSLEKELLPQGMESPGFKGF